MYDAKNLHRRLQQFEGDELKAIPHPCERNAPRAGEYLHRPASGRLPRGHGQGDTEPATPDWYVPKSEVNNVTWNRLIGIDNPKRLDQADDA